LEKITLDFEEGNGTRDIIGMQSNIRRKFVHRWRILCFLHRLAEDIGPCKLDPIIADHD